MYKVNSLVDRATLSGSSPGKPADRQSPIIQLETSLAAAVAMAERSTMFMQLHRPPGFQKRIEQRSELPEWERKVASRVWNAPLQ